MGAYVTSVRVDNTTVRIFRTQFPHNVYMGSEDLVQVIRYNQKALGPLGRLGHQV